MSASRTKDLIMTTPNPQAQVQPEQPKVSDKELNFRALEQKYQRQVDQERQARLEAEKRAEEALARKPYKDDDDNDDESYLDPKKLEKKLSKFGEQTKEQTKTEIQRAVHTALQEEKQKTWLKNNSDFYDVMQQHAEKLAMQDPELAETILSMPDGFERQKLVYKNIKALGLHKPEVKQPSIQEKIDANRKSPYYQPSSVGTAPYSSQGDFSEGGKKQAYDKMQELKARLRI